MLRVVLCIICLHPFLWLFLFALLYHTVKDFSRVNFALFRLVLHGFGFLDVLQDFNPLAVAGSQSAFTQRAHAHLLHFVSRHARLSTRS